MKKILISLLSIVLVFYTLFGFFLYLSQNKLLYPADTKAFSICSELEKSLKIDTDGFRGYFTKRSTDKIIIYYHGNGGRARDRSYMDTFFGNLGYSTLFVEYPGYAETGTIISMDNILKEVTNVKNYINNQKFKEIVIISESIGTGPAAYHVSLKDSNVNKLIMITPYRNMANVAFHKFPIYPMKLLIKDNFTPDEWLESSTIPMTIILAEKDEIIGMEEGKKLFYGILSPNKKMFTVKDAGHNSIYEKADLFNFLTEALLNN